MTETVYVMAQVIQLAYQWAFATVELVCLVALTALLIALAYRQLTGGKIPF